MQDDDGKGEPAKGMVLPFLPLSLTFQNMSYFVKMPKVCCLPFLYVCMCVSVHVCAYISLKACGLACMYSWPQFACTCIFPIQKYCQPLFSH